MVDQMEGNIDFAAAWLPQWCAKAGMRVEMTGKRRLRVSDDSHDIRVQLEQADVFEYIEGQHAPADLLIAHAVLDLLPMPASMPKLLSMARQPNEAFSLPARSSARMANKYRPGWRVAL